MKCARAIGKRLISREIRGKCRTTAGHFRLPQLTLGSTLSSGHRTWIRQWSVHVCVFRTCTQIPRQCKKGGHGHLRSIHQTPPYHLTTHLHLQPNQLEVEVEKHECCRGQGCLDCVWAVQRCVALRCAQRDAQFHLDKSIGSRPQHRRRLGRRFVADAMRISTRLPRCWQPRRLVLLLALRWSLRASYCV